MDIKKYYSEIKDDELVKRIEQYIEFNKKGSLIDCEFREDVEKYSQQYKIPFATAAIGVTIILLYEGSIRFKKSREVNYDNFMT